MRWASCEIVSFTENTFCQTTQKFHKRKLRWAAREIISFRENAFCQTTQKFHERKTRWGVRKSFRTSGKCAGEEMKFLHTVKTRIFNVCKKVSFYIFLALENIFSVIYKVCFPFVIKRKFFNFFAFINAKPFLIHRRNPR